MKSVIWKFNVMDVHFIVVIFIIFNYVGAVSIMFFVVPGRPQYIYSLLSPSKISRIDAAFLLFLGFEIYAKASQVCMMAMQEFSIFPVLLPTDFWLDYCKKYVNYVNYVNYGCTHNFRIFRTCGVFKYLANFRKFCRRKKLWKMCNLKKIMGFL